MAASAVLCVTVLPILVGLFLRPQPATAPNAEDRPRQRLPSHRAFWP